MPDHAPQLTPEQSEAFGAEMDALRHRVVSELGADDAQYLRRIVRVQRTLEITGRALLFAGFLPPAWLSGVAALSLSKILDNLEIGHNVLHGQYDWLRDEALNSHTFEWDAVAPATLWKRTHNFGHHTYTNIVGKDRDVGYWVLRVTPEQPWNPYYLGNPIYAALGSLVFEWGVALHELEVDRLLAGQKSWSAVATDARTIAAKAARQVAKDYAVFPVLSGPLAPLTFAGNASANVIRNLWAFAVIFCGHFPDDVVTFTEDETANETRGQWYVRQLLGSANITGSKLFHVLSGHLGHQIEHHLFPELPARRYSQIADEVREICRRYGLPYNTGPLHRQLGSVARTLTRLALPGGRPATTATPTPPRSNEPEPSAA